MSEQLPDKQERRPRARDPRHPLRDELAAWHLYRKYPYLLAKLAFWGALIGGIYVCLGTIDSVVFPLFLSMLLAYLLDPLIDRFEERGIRRTVAILIVIVVLLLAMVGFLAFLYPLVARQIITIIEKFPQLLSSFQNEFLPWLQKTAGFQLPPSLSEAAQQYGEEIKSAAPSVIKKAADWGTGIVSQTGVVVTSILNAVMIPLFTFYFLRDFDRMVDRAREYVPAHSRELLLNRLALMDEVVGAWFRGQIQVSLILAVLYACGLGLSFWLTGHAAFDGIALGTISGLLNVIPYVGFAVGFVLSVLVVLIEWTGIWSLIGVLIVFSIVQGMEGYIITPKIVGEKVGLSPVTVIIVLLLGGELAGLLGILLAIPIAGAIKVILPDLKGWYQSSSYFTGYDPTVEAMAADEDDEDGDHEDGGEDSEGVNEAVDTEAEVGEEAAEALAPASQIAAPAPGEPETPRGGDEEE